ncbi:NAD(P)/FAD-dependent oxidoreductase [Candidatus Formimonas warabiya]|uniref:FAD-dependent protein C-terminal domain-containing protein n=1 Tax=Formimonas warabiya TaxID=1761012 RepID=A0A3G1KS23_FORW1|nr:hypothetical protein [Candidatus Formimonas warabiya]ATW25250.1 hypothetical protein DCMF_11155 [Candidatus Formimonas warabiya]
MKLRLTNLRLELASDETELIRLAARKIRLVPEQITSLHIVKKAVDARKSDSVQFVYTVDIEVNVTKRIRFDPPFVVPIPVPFREQLSKGDRILHFPPVVIGSGPAGMFCALKLAAWGYRPLVLERGGDVDRRCQEIEKFWTLGELNPECNVQFGEGGAGTFSDGKLTTRVKDPRVRRILEQMVEAGAPEEILYLNKPHIGTDVLKPVVKGLREKIIALGGQVLFDACVTGMKISPGGVLKALTVRNQVELPLEVAVLAIGHSARDTYKMLFQKEVLMEAKPFAMGMRVEHPQDFIDAGQYGRFAGHPKLGAADYSLAYQDQERGRGAYSFCMCPGGYVVGAASEPGGVVTNGMSEHARDSGKANSALVATVDIADFGEGCLKGMEFQRKWEEKAFRLGGNNFNAPAQRLEDFLADRKSTDLDEQASSYRPGVTPANIRDCLPKEVGEVLTDAIRFWDHKIKGFIQDRAVVTGVETRTSAPLRILRNECLESVNTSGLYPAGEGAGYAGGIISAAVDGLKVAEAIIRKYREPEAGFLPEIIDKLATRGD